ncbi:hypothetical protein COOONC_16720 [Cooperia oncophora]
MKYMLAKVILQSTETHRTPLQEEKKLGSFAVIPSKGSGKPKSRVLPEEAERSTQKTRVAGNIIFTEPSENQKIQPNPVEKRRNHSYWLRNTKEQLDTKKSLLSIKAIEDKMAEIQLFKTKITLACKLIRSSESDLKQLDQPFTFPPQKDECEVYIRERTVNSTHLTTNLQKRKSITTLTLEKQSKQ